MRSAASRERSSRGGDEAAFGLAVEIVEDFRHLFMGVALGGAGQVGHELDAQGLLDLVENVLLHAFHAQHALHHFQGEFLGQGAQHAGGMFRLDLGQHHRDGLGIFVLEVVGQDGFVHIAQLVPHGAAGRAADFFHDGADLVVGQDVGQQALGGFIGAHQRAGARHLADEFHQQLLDHGGAKPSPDWT